MRFRRRTPVDVILHRMDQLENRLMATLADVAADLNAESDVIAGVVSLLETLSADLKEALASNDPAAVDAVIAQIDANKQALADAVAANTPAQP